IHRATIKAPASVVHLLIQAGADLEATFQGLASMHIACGRGLEGMVHVLLAGGANMDALTAQGFTPLHCASGRGGLGAVKALLTAGADVNIRSGGWQRRTPLHAAATLGDRAVTEELLRWGADVDLPDTEGVTSLHIAAAVDNVEVARCLLGVGASTEEVQAGTLNRPLHLAAFQGSYGVLTTLLEAGADFTATNSHGETPLHHACSMMDFAIVSTLLHRGADEAARDNNNHTCAEVLGDGLDEEAGGLRGDPAMRERILTVLAKAPAERAWRRRSWTVMMRAREANWSGELVGGGEEAGRAMVEIYGSMAAAGAVVAKAVGARDEKQPCRGRHRGNDEGSSRVGVVGVDEEAFRSCVYWVFRAQEEGIFRLVVSFL
ncbi:unnamed protein product, partial [Ectocarpus sp. 12 AP-2014]